MDAHVTNDTHSTQNSELTTDFVNYLEANGLQELQIANDAVYSIAGFFGNQLNNTHTCTYAHARIHTHTHTHSLSSLSPSQAS